MSYFRDADIPARLVRPESYKPSRDPFVQVTHKDAVAGATALDCKRFLVWHYILHRVWSDKRKTVVIGNRVLGGWGVDRKAKCQALRDLEAAGLISVEWRGRNSPVVTLLDV
jgi:hypothetical protein